MSVKRRSQWKAKVSPTSLGNSPYLPWLNGNFYQLTKLFILLMQNEISNTRWVKASVPFQLSSLSIEPKEKFKWIRPSTFCTSNKRGEKNDLLSQRKSKNRSRQGNYTRKWSLIRSTQHYMAWAVHRLLVDMVDTRAVPTHMPKVSCKMGQHPQLLSWDLKSNISVEVPNIIWGLLPMPEI